MKVIFLNIDGPMIPGRMFFTPDASFDECWNMHRYDPIAVDMINTLCIKHGAVVVMSSTHNGPNAKEKLAFNGIDSFPKNAPVCTDFLQSPHVALGKKNAIDKWLAEHGKDVEAYVVIDDEGVDDPNLVKVEFDGGISLNNFFEADALLNGETLPHKSQMLIAKG